MKRRHFVKNISVASTASLLIPNFMMGQSIYKKDKIKLGFIGVGARGLGTLGLALKREDILVTALCDIDPITLAKGQKYIEKAQKPAAKIYDSGPEAYKEMLESNDVDAVFIATPWEWHTPMSIDAMKAQKAVACEVSGATSLEECWQRVRAYEETRTPFMIMENVCYRRDVMAVLSMVRQGLFGELIHLEGGYQHDLREVKFNDGKQYYGGGVEFGEKGYSEARWRTTHSVYRDGDLYPTHGIGPIHTMIDINRGNRFEYLVSMSSKARGLNDYIVNHPQGGKNHPNANIEFKLGDIVTTQIKTYNGETIILTHDTNLVRPYSLGFRVQGTRGIWMDVNKSVHINGLSPAHGWEDAQIYLEKYDHPLWQKYQHLASGAGHGGMDWFVLNDFVEALKNDTPMPLDVYDYASWAAITCMSEQSIAQGSTPQYFPDFTNGKWMRRKPIFGL